jgi:GTPase SAR1 family protein
MTNDQLLNALKSALGVLEFPVDSPLRKDVLAICNYLEKPTFQIAVFGPFNYGKSTLLNALIGKKTLPIDLIPTTGAAIYVRYGEELNTKITLTNGSIIIDQGTDILKQYAILDDQRYMRQDVATVEVFCPHPFLETGVEFLDLPGTNDREDQDRLVKEKLLGADLILQVLDARKLMTLGERENLRDWLLDRGITSIIFVVNFLNLLTVEEQKEVQNRMRFVAESFRAELPAGISNLYRVDALPALRARLKGDSAAAQTTGLTTLASALQTIVTEQQEKNTIYLPRIKAIATQIFQAGQQKAQQLQQNLETEKQKQQNKIEIQKKAQKLIQQGFQRSLADVQSWLYLPKLLSRYQEELALTLQQGNFNHWLTNQLQPPVENYQKDLHDWVKKGCEFLEKTEPQPLSISFPEAPQIIISQEPNPEVNMTSSEANIASVAIPTGLGWVLGGPVGAVVLGGASYILNKTQKKSQSSDQSVASSPTSLHPVYTEAAAQYLTCFSEQAFVAINQYEKLAEEVMNLHPLEISLETSSSYYQLQLLNTLLANLNQALSIDN